MIRRCWFPLVLAAAACRHPDDAVRATGTIEVREVDVSPLVAARVVRVLVDDGQAVRLGDTLATLLQSTTRADIAQAEVEDRPVRGAFHDVRFGVEGGGSFVIATTRPQRCAHIAGTATLHIATTDKRLSSRAAG